MNTSFNGNRLDSGIDIDWSSDLENLTGWFGTYVHTSQWCYAILTTFAVINLVISLVKAKGRLMWTISFMIAGFVMLAFPFWFTFKTVRSEVCFS